MTNSGADGKDCTAGAGDDLALLVVGNMVPDDPEFRNAGFSWAGNLVQLGLLEGMLAAGLRSLTAVSAPPMPSHGKGGPLWVAGAGTQSSGGVTITIVPTLNIAGVKHLWAGVAAWVAVVGWGWTQRSCRVRVVCAYNLTYPPAAFTLAAAWLVGARTLVWLNDLNIPGQTVSNTLMRRCEYCVQRYFAQKFDAVVAVSTALIEDFACGRPALRIEGGVGERMLAVEHRTGMDESTSEHLLVVMAGSLDAANGVLVVIDAFHLLKGEQYRLRIVGAGPLEAAVRAAAVADPRIEYLGVVTHEQVLELYETADVLLNMRLTQILDTRYFFPSKLMEYLASGIPVLTTCTGHVEEEYAALAYLLKDETAEGLARRLAEIAEMPRQDREYMGMEAKKYMAREKTWSNQARRVLKFIESVWPQSQR